MLRKNSKPGDANQVVQLVIWDNANSIVVFRDSRRWQQILYRSLWNIVSSSQEQALKAGARMVGYSIVGYCGSSRWQQILYRSLWNMVSSSQEQALEAGARMGGYSIVVYCGSSRW